MCNLLDFLIMARFIIFEYKLSKKRLIEVSSRKLKRRGKPPHFMQCLIKSSGSHSTNKYGKIHLPFNQTCTIQKPFLSAPFLVKNFSFSKTLKLALTVSLVLFIFAASSFDSPSNRLRKNFSRWFIVYITYITCFIY